MSADKYLTYRGEIRSIAAHGGTIGFVTTHPEAGRDGGFYRLDADKLTLTSTPLPPGGLALAATGETWWLADGAGQILAAPLTGEPKVRGSKLVASATAIAPLSGDHLAALVGSQVVILAQKDGKPLQTLDVTEPGSCLAVDPTGNWLAVGSTLGTVTIFDAEAKPEFLLSGSGKLHDGAVTALLFEADDLRFFSSGADGKLLSTHARGKLEPEDKGRGNNHTDLTPALIWGPGERLYSGSRDGSIKSWPRVGGVKPSTTKDGVGKVVALALATVHDRPRLVAACDDNTLRIFPVDAAGKIGDLATRVHDAYAQAKNELGQAEAPRREAALKALAEFGDARSVELIAAQIKGDSDYALRLLAVELLGASSHPQAPTFLEGCLTHNDEAVRVAAFRDLQRRAGPASLRPIDLALKAEKADIGKLAIVALEPLASQDDQALSRLTTALDSKIADVRMAALVALEAAYDPASPESNLVALGSKHADVRRGALVRLYRRDRLADPPVQSALHRALEDADPTIRQTAFLLSLQTRARLLQVLRTRDAELQRQLLELEGIPAGSQAAAVAPGAAVVLDFLDKQAGEVVKAVKKLKGKAADPIETGTALEPSDVEPLLQASAARALDTCLRGARGLAVLGDPRAFGLLLQLSREDAKSARAEVCRAMAALDDPRAIERLRSLLHDKEAEVRDAAFTALARIHQAEPLLAAESGLNAAHEDVRRRGLQALITQARQGSSSEAARQLLGRVLNDSFASVRAEAFKSVLSLKVGGDGAGTLRFAVRSVHADVRREVLTEVMAQVAESWGLDLLLEFFNDPDATLRGESFTFALKKTKGLEFLDAALGSRYADLRTKAVEGLVKKHSAAAQTLLVRALDDADKSIRLAALKALVDADALPALGQALANTHPDVRLRAAKVFARHGDPRAREPLLTLATAPEPEEKKRQADWVNLAESALDGLGELGDPAALTALIPLLDSRHGALRKEAALALARVSPADRLDALRGALGHSDPEVKYRAAYGLACLGDAGVASLVFSADGGKIISIGGQIAAALALGPAGEGQLIAFLDDPKDEVRARALLLLMMREWKAPQGNAARVLACLASRTPRLRLTAARAIEALADPTGFTGFVVSLVNDKGDKPAWKIPEATIDALAEMLIHGDPHLQVRTARLLRHLDTDEQHPFDLAWKVHEARFADSLTKLRAQSKKLQPVALQYNPEQLRDLAFGAYVGLVREQAAGKSSGSDPGVIKVRQAALGHLLRLAEAEPRHAPSVLPVLIQALGDPNQAVRFQAFDQALALKMEPTRLAAEALASGSVDLGVRGLELLTGGTSEKAGEAVLDQAMLTRKDDLATEAAKLLIARLGPVPVATRALAAASEKLRRQAISWLAAEYDKNSDAHAPLRQALKSRYAAIREAAAFELATKKDSAAFDALVGLLGSVEGPAPQKRVIAALESLGDRRGAQALLDRVTTDPAGTALPDDLIHAAGRFRNPEVTDALWAIWDRLPKQRDAVFNALKMISGYDQRIDDPDDENPDDRWLREQHPRRDDLLARLLDRLAAPADAKYLGRMLPGAQWTKAAVVAAPLAALANHPDDAIRREVVQALGWRLKKRDGDPDPLKKALGHRDPSTQFLAAEGLALAGHADGLNVLLASIDFATDLDVRRRAVLALGELANEGAVDILLKLAAEDGHALQEPAAEAIGHLGRSPRAAEVFQILARQIRGETGVGFAALKGLRWLDTPPAWQLIRERASDPAYRFRTLAIELLGNNDEPATRDLLLKLLVGASDSPDDVLLSARKVFGLESLEPDYAALQNEDAESLDDFDLILERIQERGEAARLFEILPKCPEDVRPSLQECLLNRAEPPVAAAKTAIGGPDAATTTLAARLLGRAGADAQDAAPAVEAALVRWRVAWEKQRLVAPAKSARDSDDDDLADRLTPCLQALVWAAGRLGAAGKVLIELAEARPDDPEYRPIRHAAVLALAAQKASPAAIGALAAAAEGGSLDVRSVAAQALGRLDPKRAVAVADRLLTDAVSFRRLTLGGQVPVGDLLRAGARQIHAQGIVLPSLIAEGDVATLAKVLRERSLPEATRLGALEGLGAMASEPAEAVLSAVGADATDDEEIRKAAWRALRRSKRTRGQTKPSRATSTEVKP